MLSKIFPWLKKKSPKEQSQVKTISIDEAMNKFFGNIIGEYELFEFNRYPVAAVCRVYKQSGEYIIEILLIANEPFSQHTADEIVDQVSHTIASSYAIKEQKAILWKTHVKAVKGTLNKGAKQL
ncbi:MAG TPA: hypothetical protein DEP48_02940 [Persephonella sp.]|uniref:hypothetical protein n=1 Tax=Persephonella TaxID=182899 RepID=UPI0005A0E54F|nr:MULTISPECIES: hypothetical protein [Persephonella]HCB69294.1 hypothetical protein [Persephonella sp.]